MEVYKEFVVLPIDYKNKIAFISTIDVKNSWSFEVDWKFPLNDAKPKMFLENGNEENGKKPEAEKQVFEELAFQSIAVSEAHNLLVFTCSDKSLFLCKISGSSAVVQSRRVFLRTMSVIRFSSCGKLLFVADKTGDTFEYSCEDVNKPARWIFGHISQILDLQINSDSR
jgi:tRNA (guanine-N(7)-)-methyltransferase subunit TRM82